MLPSLCNQAPTRRVILSGALLAVACGDVGTSVVRAGTGGTGAKSSADAAAAQQSGGTNTGSTSTGGGAGAREGGRDASADGALEGNQETSGECDECNATELCVGDHCAARCSSDSDCNGERGAVFCDSTRGACVECRTNVDCTEPDRRACDTSSHTCEQCVTDQDCTSTEKPVCSLRENDCVRCTDDAHCPDGERCIIEEAECRP